MAMEETKMILKEKFNQGQVLRFLKKKLPQYKLSYSFQRLKVIPRTGSGKVERKKINEKNF